MNAIHTSDKSVSAVAEAFTAFQRELELSRAYVQFMWASLQLLVRAFGALPIRSIQPDHIRQLVAAGPAGPWTPRHRFYAYWSVFSWASARGYVSPQQLHALASAKPIRGVHESPMPLTAAELGTLLASAGLPGDLPAIALVAFAGLRVGELCRLDWSDVVLEKGFIRVAGERVGLRSIPILPVLDEWLRPFGGMEGPVSHRRNHLERIARWARQHRLPRLFQSLRRSFIANRFAATGNLDQTAHEAGFCLSGNLYKPLWRNTTEAERYFALTPKECGHPSWDAAVHEYLAGKDKERRSNRGDVTRT